MVRLLLIRHAATAWTVQGRFQGQTDIPLSPHGWRQATALAQRLMTGTLHMLYAIDLQRAYDWDPAAQIPGVGEQSILGVEGPLWAETLVTRQDYEYQAFPRIIALAELGWSPQAGHDWENFRERVAARVGVHVGLHDELHFARPLGNLGRGLDPGHVFLVHNYGLDHHLL